MNPFYISIAFYLFLFAEHPSVDFCSYWQKHIRIKEKPMVANATL
jgi:hypothetical protein